MNVKRLVKKAKKGHKEALLQLIMAQKDDYFRLAFTYMKNSHDAMDAMADMTVKLYENIHQLQKPEAFYSWSKTILVNSCKNLLRKQKKVVLLDEWSPATEQILNMAANQNPISISEQKMDIHDMLLHVNQAQREAIQLKYFHDLDYDTIANMTNVPVGTVKSRVFQGIKKLNDLYGGEADE